VGFYERSVQLDPAFALAWARLSRVNAQIYFDGLDRTPAPFLVAQRQDLPKAVTRRSGP
jgi:hypothetical protein